MNSSPSIDPANTDSLTGVLRAAFRDFLKGVDNRIPAQVIAFNAGPPARVQVQPLIMVVPVNGQPIPRAPLLDIPVQQYGSGGAVLRFNLAAGDLGWIQASDRDISLFLQSYSQARPNTNRLHSFSDSVFVPDVMNKYELLEGETDELAILQTTDGMVSLAIFADRVKVKPILEVDGQLIVNGPITSTQGISAQTINITGTGGPGNQATIAGDLRTIGDITASGNITAHVP